MLTNEQKNRWINKSWKYSDDQIKVFTDEYHKAVLDPVKKELIQKMIDEVNSIPLDPTEKTRKCHPVTAFIFLRENKLI